MKNVKATHESDMVHSRTWNKVKMDELSDMYKVEEEKINALLRSISWKLLRMCSSCYIIRQANSYMLGWFGTWEDHRGTTFQTHYFCWFKDLGHYLRQCPTFVGAFDGDEAHSLLMLS